MPTPRPTAKHPLAARLAAAVIAACTAGAAGAACHAESGTMRRPLVELYTSEGCNSCPPAERWLSSLRGDAVVAIAFHVDYWDALGWRDRFASPAFSERQRVRIGSSGSRYAYTPQFIVDGRDLPGWRRAGPFPAAVAAGARLRIDAEARPDGTLAVRVAAAIEPAARGGPGTPVVHLGLTESGLVSAIGAGENAGTQPTHDFVVREWSDPVRFDAAGRAELRREFRRPDVRRERARLVAVVEVAGGGRVLQALDLPLDSPGCR